MSPSANPGAARAADPDWFRRVLGQYPTGVSVITAVATDGAPVALTVGSFTSVSLDPPLIAFLPSVQSSSWPKIQAAGTFCVNVLAADQEPLCRAFASKAADKFAGVDWRAADSGSPILDGAVAWVDCDLETVHDAGDHLIVVGRVRDLDVERPSLPLLFFQGGYGRFSPHSLALSDASFGLQLQLIDRARPLMEALSERTGAQIAAAYCDGGQLTLLASVGAPTDLRHPSVTIGQHLPVLAPVGIWWMAFTPAAPVDEWLRDVDSPELRDRYRQALDQIRQHGYCLGLAGVRTSVEEMISHRPEPGGKPTQAERRAIGRLAVDPLDYVPPGADLGPPGHPAPAVVSLWAPTFTPQGDVALGLVLTGRPSDGRPLAAHADDLLDLAKEVTTLAGTRIAPQTGAHPR